VRVHFIGIGGIGMSALAQYYLAKGHKVSGSDLSHSEIIDLLKRKGAEIYITNPKSKTQNPKLKFKIQNADLVVYTPAVKEDHQELAIARRHKIKTLSYPQALGKLTKQYFTIAVCGTHGKSTTTAMIATILVKAGFDPTVIIGTKLREFGDSNFRMGKSKYLVIEADEHFASFLNYWPKIIVLTNIEEDHLDYYKNLNNIVWAFYQFVKHLPKNGVLVRNKDDENSKFKMQNAKLPARLASQYEAGRQCKIQNYSLAQKEAKLFKKILKIPGEHNIANALAALTTARTLKISDKVSFKALSEYHGAWRRFEELKIENCKLKIISDYAHHPTEIKATLQAARQKFPGKKIWAVFQPHQYQRTYYLFKDFIKAFDLADAIVITEIYEVAGREVASIAKKVNGQKLAKEIKKRKPETYFVKDFKKIPRFLKNKVGTGDIIVIMGAGDIYLISSPEYWK